MAPPPPSKPHLEPCRERPQPPLFRQAGFSLTRLAGGGPLILTREPSNQDPLDLIEGDRIATPVVELGGAGRVVFGDHRRLFERAAIFQVGGDAGGPEV